jgi:hypothetical protein
MDDQKMDEIRTDEVTDVPAANVDLPPPAAEEEFNWLMSLALDDAQDADDQARFAHYLASYPPLADSWRTWQEMNSALSAQDHVAPAPGFVQRFEARRLAQEHAQQRWLFGFTAIIAVLAGSLMIAATVGLGVYVFGVQGAWLGAQLHNFIYAFAALTTWVSALAGTAAALTSTPQARVLGFGYLALVCAMAAGWTLLIRRSGELTDAVSPIGLE